MAKKRSSSRNAERPVSGRSNSDNTGGRYDRDEYRSDDNRERDDDRGSNGGSRSRSYRDYEDRAGGEHLGFVKRMGNTFSNMDLEKAMVLLHTALAVAIVVKQSRDRNRERKGEPFRSAVSVLNHYLNEGRELSDSQRATLQDIKEELRMLYEREDEEMMSPSGG